MLGSASAYPSAFFTLKCLTFLHRQSKEFITLLVFWTQEWDLFCPPWQGCVFHFQGFNVSLFSLILGLAMFAV